MTPGWQAPLFRILVRNTKHGCANFMPSMLEVEEFTQAYGGL